MTADEINLTFESYGRCSISEGFFDFFYETFLGQSQEIKAMFAQTNMVKQKQLLKNGIAFMIMFAKDNPVGIAKLKQIAVIHDKAHRNVRPDMYKNWLYALLVAVKKYDKSYSESVENAWKITMNLGIEYFKSLH